MRVKILAILDRNTLDTEFQRSFWDGLDEEAVDELLGRVKSELAKKSFPSMAFQTLDSGLSYLALAAVVMIVIAGGLVAVYAGRIIKGDDHA